MTPYNPLDESQIRALGVEVVEAAQALASKRVPFLDGVRKLASLRVRATSRDHDLDFMLFVAIDSESDHIPGSASRDLCSADWLAKCDEQVSALETHYESQVSAACERLVSRFAAGA